MKILYRNKKSKKVLQVIKCDCCLENLQKVDIRGCERICSISGDPRAKNICRKCAEKMAGKEIIDV